MLAFTCRCYVIIVDTSVPVVSSRAARSAHELYSHSTAAVDLGLASFTVKHRQLSTLFRTPSQPLSPLKKVSDDEYRLLWLFICPQTLSIAHTRSHYNTPYLMHTSVCYSLPKDKNGRLSVPGDCGA